MARDSKSPIVTKKHLARVERERRQTRSIMFVSAIVIGLVLLLVGWGIVKTYIIEPRQAVANVDNVEITSREFQAYARFSRGQLIDQYAQYYQFMQWFEDEESQTSILQTLSQISYQLEPSYLGQSTIDSLVEDVLIRQEATNRGITVSEAEVDQALEEFFGYYPNGTPTTEPQATIEPTSTLSALQQTLVAPTPTATQTKTQEAQTTEAAGEQTTQETPSAETEATVLPTATTSIEAETGPTATTEVLPTPTVYSEKLYNQNMNSYLDFVGIRYSDLRWIFEAALFRQKLYDTLSESVAKESDQVWLRQILVADEETANQVIERLEVGEGFPAIATEVSIDQTTAQTGGDLGWMSKGSLDEAVENIAFELSIGEVSDPIETSTGWVVIQLLGHEVRAIPSSDYDSLVELNYNDWLTNARSAAQIEINDVYLDRVPTEPSIPLSMQLSSQ